MLRLDFKRLFCELRLELLWFKEGWISVEEKIYEKGESFCALVWECWSENDSGNWGDILWDVDELLAKTSGELCTIFFGLICKDSLAVLLKEQQESESDSNSFNL